MRTNYRTPYRQPGWWDTLTPTGKWVVLVLVIIAMILLGLIIGTLTTPS